jgi:hypothetical protein
MCTENIPRQQLQDHFDNAWTLTEVLFGSLQGESAFLSTPDHGLRHPFVFYYGHSAAFYINKFILAGVIDTRINEYYEKLFEAGVDEMAHDDLDPTKKWPTVEEIRQYRKEVYTVVCNVIDTHFEDNSTITMDDPLWSLLMGLEHDRVHLETTSVLMREMGPHLFRHPKELPPTHVNTELSAVTVKRVGEKSTDSFVHIPGGPVRIGKCRTSPSYGWDNEYGLRRQEIRPFEVSKFMVSNRDFYQFVRDGGYYNPAWWGNSVDCNDEDSGEALAWLTGTSTVRPRFWIPSDSSEEGFMLRTMFDDIEMQWGTTSDPHSTH